MKKRLNKEEYKEGLIKYRSLYLNKYFSKREIENLGIDELKSIPTNSLFLKEEKEKTLTEEEKKEIKEKEDLKWEKEFNKTQKKVERLNKIIDYYNNNYNFKIPKYFALPDFKNGSHYFYNKYNECVRISNHEPNLNKKELSKMTFYIYI